MRISCWSSDVGSSDLTYSAILAGTILAGVIDVEWAALGVVLVAGLGYWTGRKVPPAPPEHAETGIDWHIIRSSVALVRGPMHIPRPYLALLSISFFWTIGAVLFFQFPPQVKNILPADQSIASLFPAHLSVGNAI